MDSGRELMSKHELTNSTYVDESQKLCSPIAILAIAYRTKCTCIGSARATNFQQLAMEEVPEGRSRGRGQELLLIKCVIRTDAILISLRSCFNLGDRDNSARLAQDFC